MPLLQAVHLVVRSFTQRWNRLAGRPISSVLFTLQEFLFLGIWRNTSVLQLLSKICMQHCVTVAKRPLPPLT